MKTSKLTILLDDNKCDDCDTELPKGTEVVVDDELNMIFCDEDCEEAYLHEHLGEE